MSSPQHVSIVALGPSAELFMRVAEQYGGGSIYCDETWGINMNGDVLKCDRVFHMDDLKIQEMRIQNGSHMSSKLEGMLAWMKKTDIPIYTSRAYPDYPSSVDYPLEDVIKSCGTAYFNNTAVYAICFAIHLGVKKISLFGFDYTYPDVAAAEAGRACCEYWVGRAMERGIEVTLQTNTSLFDRVLPDHRKFYGYDTLDLTIILDPEVRVIKTVRPSPRNIEELERTYKHDLCVRRSKYETRGCEALERVLNMIDENAQARILDIGAGDGFASEEFFQQGHKPIALSLEDNPYTEIEWSWVKTDFLLYALSCEESGAKFDVIWASHVLEHQPNVGLFLEKCFNLLEEDGILAITVPPAKDEIVSGHLNLYNTGLLVYNMIIAGFDCSEARVSGNYTHIDGQYPYNLSVIVRKRKADLPDNLAMDYGDLDKLKKFFPLPIEHGFNGNLPPMRW